MLAIGKRPKVYLSRVPTDMRCSFEGLSARARMVIEQDPLSGHLFVFLNRQRDYIKVLYWDDGGYCIWSKRLQHIVSLIKFGAKSERFRLKEDDGRQASLFGVVELPQAHIEPVTEDSEVPARKRRARKRYTDKHGNPSHFPEHLERRDSALPPEGSLTCEQSGAEKSEFRTEITEKLQCIPAQVFVERLIKTITGCKCCKQSAPVKAASPESALPVSVYGTSFMANAMTNKFAWHLPFFRPSQMLWQQGLEISRDVLINMAIKLGCQLTPIV